MITTQTNKQILKQTGKQISKQAKKTTTTETDYATRRRVIVSF